MVRASLCLFFFVCTPVCTISTLDECKETAVHKQYIDEKKVQELCAVVYRQAVEAGLKPELLIGLSRGGLVPLCYLASEYMFNNRRVKTIGISSYTDHGKQTSLQLVFPLNEEDIAQLKQYRSILIIDDLVESGKTLSFITTLLQQALPNTTIKTATLFYKENGLFKPDFYAEVTKDWIVFPWEI